MAVVMAFEVVLFLIIFSIPCVAVVVVDCMQAKTWRRNGGVVFFTIVVPRGQVLEAKSCDGGRLLFIGLGKGMESSIAESRAAPGDSAKK